MVNKQLRKKIADAGYENSIVYDDPSFDNSIIGVDVNGKTVYLYPLMALEYVEDDFEYAKHEYEGNLDDYTSDTLLEAYEFIDYNTIRATPYMGPLAPVIIDYNPETETWYNLINGEDYNIEDIDFDINVVELKNYSDQL